MDLTLGDVENAATALRCWTLLAPVRLQQCCTDPPERAAAGPIEAPYSNKLFELKVSWTS